MKCTINNLPQLNRIVDDISKMIQDGKFVNIDYGVASKPKTKNQMGFYFGALSAQLVDYLFDCGFNVSDKDVRYYLYKKVSEFVPQMVSDCFLFGKDPRIKHLDEFDRELMSQFIDGVFQVLDQEPLFAGAKLTPDTRYNYFFHLDPEEIKFADAQKFDQHDEKYLEHIRTQPCMICGIQHRSEAHHLKDMELCGMGQKAPDAFAIPLCHQCHMNVAHGTGFKESLRWLPFDIKTACRVMYLRWKALGK